MLSDGLSIDEAITVAVIIFILVPCLAWVLWRAYQESRDE